MDVGGLYELLRWCLDQDGWVKTKNFEWTQTSQNNALEDCIWQDVQHEKIFIKYLHYFIKKVSKDGIAKVPKKNISALSQKINSVCERLAKSKALQNDTPVHVLTRLTWRIAPAFVGSFKLIINNERVRHMESNGETVNNKRNPERVKNINLMANNSFHSTNVSNTRHIKSIQRRYWDLATIVMKKTTSRQSFL